MYTPRGFGVSELGDIEVIPHGDDLHLFHLTLPNHDAVQHAVSPDGLAWRPLPVALRTGDPGAIDDDQIWTTSVTLRADGAGYVSHYTALSSRDNGRVQRVATATSADLLRWDKAPRLPSIEADPRWYETDSATTGMVSWRDPKPVKVGTRYYATICARTNDGPLPRRGCAGLLVSEDLEQWVARPPLFAPRRYWDLECPQLFTLGDTRHDGPWYLLASIMEDRSLRYWMADGPDGPFHIPPGGDLLAPPGHYAGRVTRWRGQDLLFAWHQPSLHKGWQSNPRFVDWVETRNPFGKFLAPPLEIIPRDDASLALRSFAGWDAYREAPWQEAVPRARSQFGGATGSRSGRWHVDIPSAMDLLAISNEPGDLLVEGTLILDAARGGLGLRLDEAGNGLYLELTPGSRQITLQRWGTRPRDGARSLALTYDVLQRGTLRDPIARGTPLTFRLLSCGPSIEFSLDGDVAIATMTGKPEQGAWGIWAEDGSCIMPEARWAPLRQPEHGLATDQYQAEMMEEASIG